MEANIPLPKKQHIISNANRLCPDTDIPLRPNGSVDVLEVIKSAVCLFNKKTISLGSSRSFKNSNYLVVDSKQNVKVPRESTYDVEMYRILHNWFMQRNDFEITGQWHLEQVGDDRDYHHSYCDLTITKSNDPTPVAILELLATGTIPKIRKHFDQVLKYANQLRSREVWVVHFSREDSVVSDPYWPSSELQEKGLNVVHFWHDKTFQNVQMSMRSLDDVGTLQEIIDEQILP